MTYPPAIEAMIRDDQAPTAPLAEFTAAYAESEGLWWRIPCGHHQNLFEAALARIAELEARPERVTAAGWVIERCDQGSEYWALVCQSSSEELARQMLAHARANKPPPTRFRLIKRTFREEVVE